MSDSLIKALREALAEDVRQMVREEVEALRASANSTPGSVEPLAYTVEKVAELVNTPIPTVREWIKSGALRASFTPGGRVYLVTATDLHAFLQALPVHGAGGGGGPPPSPQDVVQRILSKDRKRTGG